MRVIQKLSNVNVGKTSLGRVELTEVGQAIAHIPEFKAYFDAQYYNSNALEILNMANGKVLSIASAFNKITDTNGQVCLSKDYGTGSVSHSGDYDINKSAWSFFLVVHPAAEESLNVSRYFRFVRKNAIDSIRGLHLIISNTSGSVQQLGTSQPDTNNFAASAVVSDGLAVKPKPSLIIYSYSEGRAKIRIDGIEVANSSATEIEQGLNAGEWAWMRNVNGKYYAWGGLNIDLTSIENKQYLDDLEGYFKNKYSIE